MHACRVFIGNEQFAFPLVTSFSLLKLWLSGKICVQTPLSKCQHFSRIAHVNAIGLSFFSCTYTEMYSFRFYIKKKNSRNGSITQSIAASVELMHILLLFAIQLCMLVRAKDIFAFTLARMQNGSLKVDLFIAIKSFFHVPCKA